MSERPLHARVIVIGRVLSERVGPERLAMYRWVAERLSREFCKPDSCHRTVAIERTDLVDNSESIVTALSDSLQGVDTDRSLLLLDLTSNPYDSVPDPLLSSVAEFTHQWCTAADARAAVILIPRMPPREVSIFWPPILEGGAREHVTVVSNDGAIVSGGDVTQGGESQPLEGYAETQARLLGSLDHRMARKTLWKLGHFSTQADSGPQCARYFFDASLAVDEIGRAIAERVTQRIVPAHNKFVLLTHGARSSWLREAALNAAAMLETTTEDITQSGSWPEISPGSVGVLVFDVVSTGRTLRHVLNKLRSAGRPIAARGFAVIADRSSNPNLGLHDFSLENFITVNADKIAQDHCAQCEIGLPYTDPLSTSYEPLRAFDAWTMFLDAEWIEEPYGPTGGRLFRSIPDMQYIFQEFGDYLAHKIDLLLESLGARGELVFVCPDESHINTLVDRMAPQFRNRLVSVHIPRADFESIQTRDAPTTSRWRRQLDHLSRTRSATAVVIDEFNASSQTARALIRLLRASDVEPLAYVPVINRDTVTSIDGVPIRALYTIPSPRVRHLATQEDDASPVLADTNEGDCAALAYFAQRRHLTGEQAALLTTDFAARRLLLSDERRAILDNRFFAASLPASLNPRPPTEIPGSAARRPPNTDEDEDARAAAGTAKPPSIRPWKAVGPPARRRPVSRHRDNDIIADELEPAGGGKGTRAARGERTSRDVLSAREVDVAILTVTRAELQAARDVFKTPARFELIGNHRLYATTVRSAQVERGISVVVTSTHGPHNVPAALAVDALIRHCRPRAAFLVGIAAGIKDKFKLGDVVIPDGVHFYEPQRVEESGSRPRHDYISVPGDMQANLRYFNPALTGLRREVRTYLGRMPASEKPQRLRADFQPRVFMENTIVASGASLIADARFLQQLRERYDERLILADQESWGFATACGNVRWAIFRGVSDFGDHQKNERWQVLAASCAALCLKNFLEREYLPPESLEL